MANSGLCIGRMYSPVGGFWLTSVDVALII